MSLRRVDAFLAAVQERAKAHVRMLTSWRTDMGKSPLARKLPMHGVGVDEIRVDAEEDEKVEQKELSAEEEEEEEGDDKSSIYTEDDEDEDEPGAEQWDEMFGDVESDAEVVRRFLETLYACR